jgi:hypothetical protein
MKYSVREIELAGDLIFAVLSLLNEKGVIEVDLNLVNYSVSALGALEREYIDGPEEEDGTTDGLRKKGIRFALAAVDFEGAEVISIEESVCFDVYLKSRSGSCAFWGDGYKVEDAWSGKNQIVHSDLMVTSMDQIKVGNTYFEYRKGCVKRLIKIESIDSDNGWIYFIDVCNKDDNNMVAFKAADRGIEPYKEGNWDIANWLEMGPEETKC